MPVPRASPATTAAGARSALPAAGRAATGHVQYGLPRRSAPSSRWRGLYRRGVPEFVVGYRHPTRRWPPSSTGGNLNSAAALSHLPDQQRCRPRWSGSATGWPPARGPLSRARSIQPARRQVRGPRAWNARSSARSAKNWASTAPICEERSMCRRRPTPQPTAQRRAPSPARIKRRPTAVTERPFERGTDGHADTRPVVQLGGSLCVPSPWIGRGL